MVLAEIFPLHLLHASWQYPPTLEHRALNILTDLAENTESESVRLGATRDLLYIAGFRPVDRN